MPNKENQVLHYLKAISMFDPKKDFIGKNSAQSKDDLAMAFRYLIMSDDPKAIEFFTRFMAGIDNVIKDMNIVDKTAVDNAEDETMPETPPEAGSEQQNTNDNMLPSINASYNHFIDMANSYIYM